MCLAIPMKVVDVIDEFATVELNGVKKNCYIGMLDDKPVVEDYLLVHAGMAIKLLEKGEEKEILDNLSIIFGDKIDQ